YRPGRGRVRPRARVPRDGARRPRAPLPAPPRRGRAREHPRSGGVRSRERPAGRRDDHRASSALQPRRAVRGWLQAALLLPTGAQARGGPPGTAARGDERRSEVLSGHRQRAARPLRQGEPVRARRRLLSARRDRALRRSVRAGRRSRQARGIRELPRAGVLPAAAQRRNDHAAQGALDGFRRATLRRDRRGAAARGRARRLAPRGGMSGRSWKAALVAPVFDSLRPLLSRLPPERFPRHDDLNALGTPARSGSGAPIRFVAPSTASKSAADYEIRIFDTGEVATRPGSWHDLFNALAWLAFPKTKAVLNRRHRDEVLARRGEPQRGTARDVLTLFDEGGVLVACADTELSALLREFRWKGLFWERREEARRSMRFHVFGHAIYEKALEPYPGVTAKALIVAVEAAMLDAPVERQLAELDARAAAYFSGAEALASTRSLSPLPILGVPGWSPANEREAYYDDASQFRPGRADG